MPSNLFLFGHFYHKFMKKESKKLHKHSNKNQSLGLGHSADFFPLGNASQDFPII